MRSYIKKALMISIVCTPFIQAYDEQTLINHVKKSIENASNHISKITEPILNIPGMSGAKGRHLLNNLCSLPGARYLEIGVFKGSTFVAALYGNTATLSDAIAIDNWSEFGYSNDIFLAYTRYYLSANSFRLFEKNCFALDLKSLTQYPIDIYFYDGHHTVQSQRKAFTYFNDIFADLFIAVVDDWEWQDVQKGTHQAFSDLEYTILFEEILRAGGADSQGWWNGMYVAVLKKRSINTAND